MSACPVNCPKCNAVLIEQHGTSLVSSMSRGEAVSDVIHGYSCLMCGYWKDISLEVPKLEVSKGFRPNSEMKQTIISLLLSLWDEIKVLRNEGIAWKTIRTTMNIPYATTTIAMHWRNLLYEREGVEINKRCKQGKNYGVRKMHKQESIIFGRRLK